MTEILKLSAGDRVRLKKQHPCGCWEWTILRAGNDVKVKCCGCGRLADFLRSRFERQVRGHWGPDGRPK